MGAFLDPVAAGGATPGPKKGLRVVAALWLTVILGVSVAPLAVKTSLHTIGHLHNALHFAAFFVAASLMTLGSSGWRYRLLRGLLALLFAVATEYLEAAISLIKLEWRDVRTDAWGIAAGLLMAYLLRWWMAQKVSDGLNSR